MDLPSQYPIFGPEIKCPHCDATIGALTLTDSYLCSRHGAFEADGNTGELVHLHSGRHWRYWQDKWYRQHNHPDGIRFEIHEALDRLYLEGYLATKITISYRYQDLMISYLETGKIVGQESEFQSLKLYGIPVEFSDQSDGDPSWEIVNFTLEKKQGIAKEYPYYQLFE
jgi:uncharacterized protein (TIGR02652 family)